MYTPSVYCSWFLSANAASSSVTIAATLSSRQSSVASMTFWRYWVANSRLTCRATSGLNGSWPLLGRAPTRKRSKLVTVIPSQEPNDIEWATIAIHSAAAGVGVQPPEASTHTASSPNRATASATEKADSSSAR